MPSESGLEADAGVGGPSGLDHAEVDLEGGFHVLPAEDSWPQITVGIIPQPGV